MAVQSFPAGHALAVQLWSKGVEAEVLKKLSFAHFMGKRPDSLCHVKDELTKSAGDTITYALRMQLDETVAPKVGNATLENNERTVTYYSDSLTINQLRDATRVYQVMDRQRVNFDQREEGKVAVGELLSAALDQAFFNHLAGYTVQTNLGLTGNNAITAASTVLRPSPRTTDESLTSAEPFALHMIDVAVEYAKTRTPAMRPAFVPGMGYYYVCFLHPYQVTSLRASASDWTVLQRDAMQGGAVVNNPRFTGHLGTYNGTLLVESSRVPPGVRTDNGLTFATARRAVFCGAQALGCSWGRFGGNPNKFRWVEDMFDYENELGIAAGCVVGMKKLVFNAVDYAVLPIATYATVGS